MKEIGFFLVFWLLALVFPAQLRAGEIQDFSAKITVNQDGTIKVAEKLSYDFGSSAKHGIFRQIPVIKKNDAGKKFRLDLYVLSVTDAAGNRYPYTKSQVDSDLKLKIGDPDRTITGKHTYLINYQVGGALTYLADHDELYWNVTGNESEVPIRTVSTEVQLPARINPAEIKTVCYTGYLGSQEQLCSAAVTGNQVEFKSQTGLLPAQGLTIGVGFPKNIVAVLEPKPVVDFWKTWVGGLIQLLLILAAVFWYVGYPFWISLKWFRFGRDPKGTLGDVRVWFDPPQIPSGRFLTPAETGALVDETVDLRDFSALIVHLAQRGYLKIAEKKKNDFYLMKNKEFDRDESLLPFEKEFLKGIFADKEELRLKKAKINPTLKATADLLYTGLVKEKLFPESPDSIRKFYGIIAGVALVTLNLPLFFAAALFGRQLPRKTSSGANAAKVAKSLKNFLASQERQLEYQAKNQMFFERFLPYAVAFGVEKIWAKRFADITVKPPEWYQGYQLNGFNTTLLINSLDLSLATLASSVGPVSVARSTSGFSSGFSGGSSGGGGGGGGAGSW